MGFKGYYGIISSLILIGSVFSLSAQDNREQTDSLVRLMKGASLELIENNNLTYRKAIDATFLHNGTYLICDTALWNVNFRVINAWGNVKLIQDETILTSESLDYVIDENLAEFRGSVVQLSNKDDNILRSSNLDYNTKDSVAVFRKGASMKDKDGQIIESLNGTYDSRTKLFDFDDNVNMYTDSVFVKTSHLVYDSGRNRAVFTDYIDFWNEANMLSASGGWYDRNSEVFFFKGDVHGLSERQECWCDSLFVYRNSRDIEMLGRAQIQDTSRHVAGLANRIYYCDTLSQVTMNRDAAVAMSTRNEKGKVDTIYAGADTLKYRAVRMCDISEEIVADARKRLKNMTVDAVSEYRKRAAEAAAKAKADKEAEMNAKEPDTKEPDDKKTDSGKPEASKPEAETAPVGPDTLFVKQDTVPPPPDTARMGFMTGVSNVRIFKRDIQVRCDSMAYCDIDSIARFYRNPVVWNDGNRQYTSDSLYTLVRNGGMDRASLMGNAFIVTQEDSIRFDQIKGTEVIAFFDSTSALRRFDALGGAMAMFYLKEDETLATVNKVESKMLSAVLKDGNLDRVYYFDSPKNDAFPVAQMKETDHRMKGFNWQVENRPSGPGDITSLTVKPTEREYYETRPKAAFKQTDRFFPGYMHEVYESLEEARIRKRSRKPIPADTTSFDSLPEDSLLAVSGPVELSDSVAFRDSLQVAVADSVAIADSLAVIEPKDSVDLFTPPTKKELREEARKLAIARRDAKWAEKDAKDAARAAAKEQKKLERRRARTAILLKRKARQDAKDAAKLEKYRQRYESRKARDEAKGKITPEQQINEQESEPSGERTPETVPGREL